MLNLVAAFIGLTALLTYLNYRFVRLPPAIGVMATALVLSLGLHGLSALGYPLLELNMQQLIRSIDFSQVLMTWFLPALLFAGALHVNFRDLASYKISISFLATAGVLLSTVVTAALAYYTFDLFGWHVSFLYCLLFGALISPTDAIAVMGILNNSGAPKPLQTIIVGESLFNDGTAVVLYSMVMGVLLSGASPTLESVSWLFMQEAVGGVLFGLALGYGAYFLMRTVDNYQIVVMLTLALVFAGAALSAQINVSAPIVAVVGGLVVGNVGRRRAMSAETRRYVDGFWELIDSILNTLLFALIGMELLLLPLSWPHVVAGLLLGAAVLVARGLTVAPGIFAIRTLVKAGRRNLPTGAIRVLVWGGLRGGVSVALALSLPKGPERDLLLALTYIVVLVSILLQGMSMGILTRKLFGSGSAATADKG